MMGIAGAIAAIVVSQVDAKTNSLSLSDAIRASILHSAEVKEAQGAYLAARARTGEATSRQLPQLGFEGSVTRYDNRTTVAFPGSNTPFVLAPNNEEALTLALNQDLDVSGQLGLTASQARLNVRSAQYTVEATSADQALTTTTAYYSVLRAVQNVRVAAAALDAYREQQRTATRLYKGGVGQRIDVDRADSQVAEAESDVVRRQNELNAAQSNLNDLLGVPLDQSATLDDSAISAASESPYDTAQRPALIAKALSQRPEALEARVEVAAARKGIRIARTTSAPDAMLSLTGTRYPTTSFTSPRQYVAALSFTVSIPIFDGGLAREKVSEAKDLAAVSEAREDRIRRDISLQVQNAALDVETAKKRKAAATVELKAAIAARKLAQQRFEAQVGLYLEVTDAQSALTSAQSAEVQATYDLLIAQAQLAHALSEPIVK